MLAKTSESEEGDVKGVLDEGAQDVMRPSELVWDVKEWGGDWLPL